MLDLVRPLPLEDCVVDLATGRVVRDGAQDRLTTRECALLAYLAARPDVEVSRDEILAEVWGYAPGVATRAVDATALRLRTKIERDPSNPRHLITVWGTGYRFAPAHAAAPRAPAAEVDGFVGREAEQARVSALLDGAARLVTVLGPPGIGKSRLASRIAGDPARRGAVITASLDGASGADALVRRVGQALDEAADRLPAALAGRGPLLLVLDEAEQALEAVAGALPTWLRLAPDLRVLVTSRTRLDIAGEVVIELPPLSERDAVQLLVDRAGGPVAPDVARRIVARVDHLPLGIELAAGLLPLLAPEAVLARLDAPLDALVGHRRDAPSRHASLRHALAGSWALLDAAHREALSACAVFRGSFPVEAAAAVVGDESRLRGLRARSLVASRDGRLVLLATVRAFVHEVAPPTDAIARHWRYHAAEVAKRLDPKRAADPVTLAWVDAELDELRAAFEHALPVDPTAAAWLAAAIYQPLGRRGPIADARAVLDRAIAAVPDSTLKAHLHQYRGHLLLLAQETDGARADADAAVRIAEAVGDPDLYARGLALHGIVALHRDDVDTAIRDLEDARARLEAVGDSWYAASVANNLGNALSQAERLDDARAAYTQALRLHRAAGNTRSEALTLANLGLLDALQRRYAGARARLEVALAGHRTAGDAVNEALALAHLGNVALAEGAHDEAIAWFEAGERAIAGSGFTEIRGRIGQRRAVAHAVAGRTDAALRVIDAIEPHLPLDDAALLLDRALTAALAGRPRDARGALERCGPITQAGMVAQRGLIDAVLADLDDGGGRAAALATAAEAEGAAWMHELRPWFRAAARA